MLDVAETATHCPYCALQCGMRLASSGNGRRVDVAGDVASPVSRGQMCVKGWTAGDLLASAERLRYPRVRGATGQLRRATWQSALDELAERLARVQTRFGNDGVGVFGSGALTNEKAYLLGKFARVALRTANIDYNGRFCMSSAAAAANAALGIDRGLPFPVSDIAQADTVLVWGSNWVQSMPPIGQWFDEQRARGGTMIVADPRRTATARRADLHLQMVPGTDLAVAQGLLHLAVTDGLVDFDYLDRRTVGFDDVRRSVLAWAPDRVEQVTGVARRVLQQTVHALADAPASLLLSGRGPEQQSKGVDTVLAFINLMLALGKIGRPSSGYGCLTGQGNGQGGREHGQKADQLPGYRLIEDAGDREAVAAAWGVPAASLPGRGLTAAEMLGSLGTDHGVRALLVAGSNVVVASPDSAKVAEGLARLECLAVLDAFSNDTVERADIVLPVTQWAEEDGTMTNLEGRVIRRRRAVAPPPEVRSDLDVLCALADRLGHGDRFGARSPEAVFDELAAVSAGGRADYSGITYERLDATGGIFWPCPDRAHLGTPRLFGDRFAHPDGRARLVPVRYRPAAEHPDARYPYYFTTGRLMEHYNSGAQTRMVPRLAASRPEPLLQIHPQLARCIGLAGEGRVVVESRRGTVTFSTVVDPDIRTDTVFAPFHWGGRQAANLLTNPALDPTSRMPEFKVCAVQVTVAEATRC